MYLTCYCNIHNLIPSESFKAPGNTRCRIVAVAQEIANINFRVNNARAEGGSKLHDGKFENVNGAAITLPKGLPPPFSLLADKKSLNTTVTVIAAALRAVEWQKLGKERIRTSSDDLRRGRLVDNDSVYQQTFDIRSYEVGFDKTASIETMANLFQETALNHVGKSDFVGDGMGTTHAMMRNRLIWVITRMHVEVIRYPVWGDNVQIDSWVSASGKNGMRRDFLVRDFSTGQILARSTSNWAMMNQDTRRLSKMPDDVRAEISPYFLEKSVMTVESNQRIRKLDNSATYIKEGLAPKLHDMDMNKHVNHVKYIGWVLESVPESLLDAYELQNMTLEYRKECSLLDVVSSFTQPESSFSPCCTLMEKKESETTRTLQYTHLLNMERDGTEILRGKTEWRLKEHLRR